MCASYFFGNTKPSHVEYYFKKYVTQLKAPKTSIYKNNFFTSCTQKTAMAKAVSMENHILQYCRWVV